MSRFLAFASIAALLTAAAQAQCLGPATGAPATFVQWDGDFTSTWPVDDEGLTSPPIAFTAFPNFPMAGAVGNLDQMWIGANGEIYLTDSTLALSGPVGGVGFGITFLDGLRGAVANASARIVVCGDDLDKSDVLGAVWSVNVDQSVPGQVRVTWIDAARYGNTTDRFSFDCTLFSDGSVQCSYDASIAADLRLVGISVGNMVGSVSSPSRDLKSGADSGTEGLLYESFLPLTWDLSNASILMYPNGIGGYASLTTCSSAYNTQYGTGCYTYTGVTDSVHEFFALPSQASAALQGNGMILTPTANGYNAQWLPGGSALYLAPTGAATNVFAVATDDGNIAVTPSVAVPVPGGTVSSLNVMSNGVVSFGAATAVVPNDYTPTSAEFATTTVSAVYTWHDWNEFEAGSGRIKRQEVGNILYITWQDVESYADPDTAVNRGTVQMQFNLTTGVVVVVWPTISTDDTETLYATGRPFVVGLGGPGAAAAPPITLSTGLPVTTSPNVTLSPLTLSASPAPVYTIGGSSVPVTWTATNVVDAAPPFGIGVSLLLFSVAPFPGGLDMGFLGMPGCNLNIASLDVTIGLPSTAPTASITLAVPQPLSPGLSFYSQVLSLFAPNSLPNGQNAFGGVLSNGVQSYFNTF